MELIAIQDWQKWLWSVAPFACVGPMPEFKRPEWRSRHGNAQNVFFATPSLVSALVQLECRFIYLEG